MTLTTVKWTIDDYHRMIDAGILDDRHAELLGGEIVEMSPEGVPHANLSSEGADYLRELFGKRVKIREAKPVTLLSENSEPEPDIAICHPVKYDEHHPYPGDIFWLIEFSNSSLTTDRETKSKIYAKAEIQEYWVVNLCTIELIVLRDPANGEYQSEATFIQGDIQPLAFPDVSISIRRLLGKL